MLCRNGRERSNCVNRKTPQRNRHASIKKCAVIVSGVRRQLNGVERPPSVTHFHGPEKFSTTPPPALPECRDRSNCVNRNSRRRKRNTSTPTRRSLRIAH